MTDPVSWPTVTRSLIAILRGIRPEESESIVAALLDSGFELIEVPLNSPEPFASIERLSRRFGKDCLIGAGTVLSAADCARVADAGGRLMVAPNVDTEVLYRSVTFGTPAYLLPGSTSNLAGESGVIVARMPRLSLQVRW